MAEWRYCEGVRISVGWFCICHHGCECRTTPPTVGSDSALAHRVLKANSTLNFGEEVSSELGQTKRRGAGSERLHSGGRRENF